METKLIKGFENYTVSSTGVITNIKTNKTLKLQKDTKGYYMFTLRSPITKKRKAFRIHVVVASHFIDENFLESGLKVNHIDGDKANNDVSNLEIVTQKENIEHAYKHGLRKNFYKKILQIDIESGDILNEFATVIEVSKFLGITVANTSKGIKKGIYRGFVWERIENV